MITIDSTVNKEQKKYINTLHQINVYNGELSILLFRVTLSKLFFKIYPKFMPYIRQRVMFIHIIFRHQHNIFTMIRSINFKTRVETTFM